MRFLAILLAACVAAAYGSAISNQEKKIVCYFGSWAVYRPGRGKFDIKYIDPTLCTHLIYTFTGLNGDTVKVLDAWQDLPDNWGKDGFGRFNALREISPSTKTLIAIGGWNEGSTKYSKMASDPAARERFADNVVKFIKKWNFDGFDLDWEYPNQRGGSPSDIENHVELLKALRTRFDKEGLILSAAVAAAESSASKSYKISEVSKYLDFINLMAYDFHGAWESQTGINAPLRVAAADSGDYRGWNVESSVNYWLKQGAPKEKLILGVPLYGRAFTLSNPKQNKIGAPTRGPGAAGPYTREAGMLGYNEICKMLQKRDWNVIYDEERCAPYAYKDQQWVGFDNIKSIREKAQLAKKMDLGGAMIWSVETDDFHGDCGEKYPLLKTLNAVLRGGKEVSNTEDIIGLAEGSSNNNDDSTASDSTLVNQSDAPASPVIQPTPTGKCSGVGNMAIEGSCDFSMCSSDGQGGFNEHVVQCAEGLCFNPNLGICDWKKSN
uniref:chitinase n=1 Tax=Toxoneuron nigriceps TaxID=51531 RepID=Q56JI1_9HYME|nr:teratocyte released chitinase [Toxoneuron nigriceps]